MISHDLECGQRDLNLLYFNKKRASVTPCDAELERVMGIEPTSKAWEAFVLPLNYTRKKSTLLRPDRAC